MKRLLLILTVATFGSCHFETNETYTLKYVVFYPNYNDTNTVSATHEFYWGSDRGSNFIKHYDLTGPTIYDGSAPYKIISYTKK